MNGSGDKQVQYDIGQEVTLRLENSVLKGRISDITLTSAQLTFPVQYALPPKGTLIWPDGLVVPIETGNAAPHAHLTLRLPLPTRRTTKRFPGETESADHRRTVRIDVPVQTLIADFTGTRRLMTGRTLNLSSGGALVLCEATLMVGRDYTLKLDLADEQMAFKARVVRRVGHNTYAFRFLTDSDTGHVLMRKVFMMLRAAHPGGGRRSSWNFRKA